MISEKRAVIGKDLETVREKLGLNLMDACYIFGLSMQQWSQTVSIKGDEPISNASLALLARYYDKYPFRAPVPTHATPADLVSLGLDVKEVGIILGREISAGYRWISGTSRTSPAVDRLATHIVNEVIENDELDEWIEVVRVEGSLRGNSDIMIDGCWNVARRDAVRTKNKAVKKAK